LSTYTSAGVPIPGGDLRRGSVILGGGIERVKDRAAQGVFLRAKLPPVLGFGNVGIELSTVQPAFCLEF
jgi:hypothetical protein